MRGRRGRVRMRRNARGKRRSGRKVHSLNHAFGKRGGIRL